MVVALILLMDSFLPLQHHCLLFFSDVTHSEYDRVDEDCMGEEWVGEAGVV